MTSVDVVVLGDSVSEGVGDPDKGRLLGWIHYLTSDPEIATGLNLRANLALTGAKVADIRRDQLPRALATEADLFICVIGVNDVMSSGFRPTEFAADYDYVIGELAKAARRGVLTMTLHDIAAVMDMWILARFRFRSLRSLHSTTAIQSTALRSRVEQANAVIEETAVKHGAWLLEARDVMPMRGSGMISIDRLHPNRRGHRYIAAIAATELHARGIVPTLPGAAIPPPQTLRVRSVGAARHGLWLGQHLTEPLVRRIRIRGARRIDGE